MHAYIYIYIYICVCVCERGDSVGSDCRIKNSRLGAHSSLRLVSSMPIRLCSVLPNHAHEEGMCHCRKSRTPHCQRASMQATVINHHWRAGASPNILSSSNCMLGLVLRNLGLTAHVRDSRNDKATDPSSNPSQLSAPSVALLLDDEVVSTCARTHTQRCISISSDWRCWRSRTHFKSTSWHLWHYTPTSPAPTPMQTQSCGLPPCAMTLGARFATCGSWLRFLGLLDMPIDCRSLLAPVSYLTLISEGMVLSSSAHMCSKLFKPHANSDRDSAMKSDVSFTGAASHRRPGNSSKVPSPPAQASSKCLHSNGISDMCTRPPHCRHFLFLYMHSTAQQARIKAKTESTRQWGKRWWSESRLSEAWVSVTTALLNGMSAYSATTEGRARRWRGGLLTIIASLINLWRHCDRCLHEAYMHVLWWDYPFNISSSVSGLCPTAFTYPRVQASDSEYLSRMDRLVMTQTFISLMTARTPSRQTLSNCNFHWVHS